LSPSYELVFFAFLYICISRYHGVQGMGMARRSRSGVIDGWLGRLSLDWWRESLVWMVCCFQMAVAPV
jgi:hypothetical protein